MSSLNPRAPSFKLDTSKSSTSSAGLDSLSPSPTSSKSRGGGAAGSGDEEGQEEQHGEGKRGHATVAPPAVVSVGAPTSALHPPEQSGGRDSSPSTSSLLIAPHPPPAAAAGAQPPRDDAPSPFLYHRRRTTRSLSPSPSFSPSLASTVSSRYSLLPLSTFKRLHLLLFALTFLLLFLLPVLLLVAYRREVQWPPFALGVASWLAGETLREVTFELFTFEPSASQEGGVALPLDGEDGGSEVDLEEQERRQRSRRAASALALPTVIHSIAQEALRLGAVALAVKLLPTTISLLRTNTTSSSSSASSSPHHPPPSPLPPLDPLFFSVLWLALGWAAVEILWGSRRLWKQLELYEEVLGPGEGGDVEEGVLRGVPRVEEERGDGSVPHSPVRACGQEDLAASQPSSLHHPLPPPPQQQDALYPHLPHHDDGSDEDDDLDEETFQLRLREVQRDELEAQLGVPLYEIPVGVVLVWRIDSILLSLLFTLLLSLPFRLTPPSLFAFPLAPTFIFVSLTHALLSLVWVAKVTTWGVPAISYASLVALVMGVLGALGAWGVLQ